MGRNICFLLGTCGGSIDSIASGQISATRPRPLAAGSLRSPGIACPLSETPCSTCITAAVLSPCAVLQLLTAPHTACVWFGLGVVVFCGEVMPLEPSPPWMVRRYGLPILHAVPRRRLNASPCLTRPWRSVFSSKVIKHIRFFKIFLLVLLVFFSPVYASRTSPLSHTAVAVFNSRTALAKIFFHSPLVLLIAGASEVRPIVWRPS